MTKLLLRLHLSLSLNRAKQRLWLGFLTSFAALMTILINPVLANPNPVNPADSNPPTVADSPSLLLTQPVDTNPAPTDRTDSSQPVCPNSSRQTVLSLPPIASAEVSPERLAILRESWLTYRDRFIQADGRVIDREDNDRTVSEGQAYAMLRAVMINDPDTFDRTFIWAENNLRRKDEAGEPTDSLWAWKWGEHDSGEWRILDANFASDADLDAAYALILAARRWNCSAYLDIAREKLNDLWELSTGTLRRRQYFIPGPKEAFWNDADGYILNSSYFAPYAFRLFAQVDPDHRWMRLVNSSYEALERDANLSRVGLPSDWVAINPRTGRFQPLPASHPLITRYGFDAYRVWWRITWDAAWFQERKADRFLRRNLSHLEDLWQTEQQIPARIDLSGAAIVDYEATSQYAMLYYAFSRLNPDVAEEIYQQKLLPAYNNGIWDNDTAYYTQNLVWFGLLPTAAPREFLQTEARTPCWFSFHFLSSVIRSATAS
ncbi:glycosyl hydrolase family 8 [Egbenema bharatensis]|uniref:glycosyl hydrolase family 8 n=1 Tax=Egbenema bharatensis TaxID=3463334 RepID=UPI003A83DF06